MDMARSQGYQHGEAFAVMVYRCKAGHEVRVWNSRDGVTPFTMGCKAVESCVEYMAHTVWQHDAFLPDHRPQTGEYFWRDGTVEEARQIMLERIQNLRGDYPLTPEDEAQLLTNEALTSGEFQYGWPMLDQAK